MLEVQGDGRRVVLDLLAEGIGQAGEPAHSHPHREVLALDVAGGDVLGIGTPKDHAALDPDALRRRIPALILAWVWAVELLKLGVVDVALKRPVDGDQVGVEPVCRQLNPIRQA